MAYGQMRTMRIGLRHFLFKIKASDLDRCNRGKGTQTPTDVLLQYSLYMETHGKVIHELLDVEGHREELSDHDAPVSDPQAIRYVVEFMHQTGLLSKFCHAELTEVGNRSRAKNAESPTRLWNRCGRR